MTTNRFFLLVIITMLHQMCTAQNKGSFDTSIYFMNAARKVAVYVPTNYDSTKRYGLMVMLHGSGDDVVHYRDALISSYSLLTYVPNTIFVFPEMAGSTYGYYYPSGYEAIIQNSIEYAKQIYNIDSDNIVLQGFSLGGRSALRYGLEHPSIFKGILLILQQFKD